MSNSSPNPVDPSCASEDLLNALTSPFMIFNHFFILSVIFAGFVVSRFAIRKLLNQNVFPTCTKILLLTSVINGIIHQGITAVIRVKTVVRAIRFANDPCSILFLTADCFVDGIVYYHTNLFSSIVCISLFLDRLLSSNPRSFYNSFQTTATVIFIILQIGIPILLIYWIFYDSAYTSYVAMCNYPTATASVKFFYVTSTRLYVLGFVLVISVILFIKNSKKEKQMVHNVYDTESRYNTYENYLATKAICWVIFSQVVCLLSTSFIPTIFKNFQDSIPVTWYHLSIAFATGLTYANFLVPIIICHQINQISKVRRLKINSLVISEKSTMTKEHFDSLKEAWNNGFQSNRSN